MCVVHIVLTDMLLNGANGFDGVRGDMSICRYSGKCDINTLSASCRNSDLPSNLEYVLISYHS